MLVGRRRLRREPRPQRPCRREREPARGLVDEGHRRRLGEDHEAHDDRADADEERLEHVREDDAEEPAQRHVDAHDGQDDERRLPARQGQELLGELARPHADEHQVADHQDEQEDGRREPGRLGVLPRPEARLVPLGEGHDPGAADVLGLEGHVEADDEPAPEDVRRPHRFEPDIEDEPDHGHRAADVDVARAARKAEHPPGDVPVGQVKRIELFRRPLPDDDSDHGHGEEVNADDDEVDGVEVHSPFYTTAAE